MSRANLQVFKWGISLCRSFIPDAMLFPIGRIVYFSCIVAYTYNYINQENTDAIGERDEDNHQEWICGGDKRQVAWR